MASSRRRGRRRRRRRLPTSSMLLFVIAVRLSGVVSQEPTFLPTTSFAPTGSRVPSTQPSVSMIPSVSMLPTRMPVPVPSGSPSVIPTTFPSMQPSLSFRPTVSSAPSQTPTITPIPTLSAQPSFLPTISSQPTESQIPSQAPSVSVQPSQSKEPSNVPTKRPSSSPSMSPSLSFVPSSSPEPSMRPSVSSMPTISSAPSSTPTQSPAPTESLAPSTQPSTSFPSSSPTAFPTKAPSVSPTDFPSLTPSFQPTFFPSSAPTRVMTSVTFNRNFMSIRGMDDLTEGKKQIWNEITSEHIMSFWNSRPLIDIVVANVTTTGNDTERISSTVVKAFYDQRITYSVRNDVVEERGQMKIIATRPFETDFQRYADALHAADLAPTSFLTLVEISIGDFDSSDNTGAIVGAVLGSIIGLGMLVFGVYYYKRKQRQKRLSAENYQEYTADLAIHDNVILPQDASSQFQTDPLKAPSSPGVEGSDIEPFSIGSQSYNVGGNVSELSFHSDSPHEGERSTEDDPGSQNDDENEVEVESSEEDEEEAAAPMAPAFDMQIDDLEDMQIDDLEDIT